MACHRRLMVERHRRLMLKTCLMIALDCHRRLMESTRRKRLQPRVFAKLRLGMLRRMRGEHSHDASTWRLVI